MADLIWYYQLYIGTSLTAAGILLLLSLYAWRHRTVIAATGFFLVMTVSWGWMLFAALELIPQALPLKSFFNNIRFSFSLGLPFTAFITLMQFTGHTTWLQPRRLVLVALTPCLGLLLVWTNSLHHLLWRDYVVVPVGTLLIPVRLYGWWYYVNTSYNQLMALVELGLLIHAVFTLRPPYRSQALMMLLAVSSVVLTDLLWVFHLVSVPGPGLYPFSMVLMGLLFAWALFRYQLFDLVPVSHQALIQHMHDSLFVLDGRLRVVELNPAAQHLSGQPTTQVIGQPALAVLPASPQWPALLASDQIVHNDLICQHQGTTKVFATQLAPLRDQRGLLIGRLLVLRDITERKQIEQALQASETRFRLLAENAQHIIFRIALLPTLHFDYLSPALTPITGYTPEELHADPALWLRVASSESRALLLQMSNDDAAMAAPVVMLYTRKDGQAIWLEQEQWPIYAADGQRIAIEGVARDVTWRKEAEQQRADQQEALTILHERERLARELHDSLGQVLGYVNTQAQAIRDLLHPVVLPQATTMLDQIIEVAQHELTDIREYLLGVQMSNPRPTPAPDAGTQRSFFEALEVYLHAFARLAGIVAELELPPALTTLAFTPTVERHLLRIIQEALSNVRKHAQATRVLVQVAVVAATPGEPTQPGADNERWLVVSIADNGRGFPLPASANEAPLINSSYGLQSMRGRAVECGGSLEVAAALDGGTRVTIRMPLRRQQDLVTHTLRVLLVDDSPLFLHGLANLLTGRGFQVLGTAADGFAALEQAQRLQPEIILMDVEMPGCDGLEATRAIKRVLPAIQIVMLTVSDNEAHLFEALKSGAAGYLLKSLDGDELCKLLRGVVRGEMPLSPGLARKVLHEFTQRTPTAAPVRKVTPEAGNVPKTAGELSPLQTVILQLAAEGHTYREIGEQLGYAERTIKKYMGDVLRQLHLKNRAEAVAFVRRSLS